jgi:16S rRNA (guanine527-N7)-methyltransferase
VEHRYALRDFAIRSICELGLDLTEEQAEQFMLYLEQLVQWNKVINLTSITDPRGIVIKHFTDSLTALLAADFPSRAVVIDVGAGAGFPGIPIKIVRNDVRLVLVEPVHKKCSFLSSIVGLLKLTDVTVFPGTLKQYGESPAHLTADRIVVRALRFDEIEDHAARLLNKTGKVLLYRTEKMASCRSSHGFVVESEKSFSLPNDQGHRVISVIAQAATG